MMCHGCFGYGAERSVIGSNKINKCRTCNGTGVMYTQSEMDVKDREIETLNNVAGRLINCMKDMCACCVYLGKDGCENYDCSDGVIEYMRLQAEKELENK